jgi:hypothetical protein
VRDALAARGFERRAASARLITATNALRAPSAGSPEALGELLDAVL